MVALLRGRRLITQPPLARVAEWLLLDADG